LLIRLGEAQERLRGRLFERDSHPLWKARELRETEQPISMQLQRSVDREWTSTWGFLSAKKPRFLGLLILYALGLWVAFKLKGYVSQGPRQGVPEEASKVFARPFSLALLVAMLGMAGHASLAPSGIAFVIYLLCLILALRVLAPLTDPGLRPLLYTLAAFNVLEGLRELMPLPPVLKRELAVLGVLLALVIFAWFARPSRLRRLGISRRALRVLVVWIRVGIFLLAVSLVANISGFVFLSHVLSVATLLGGFVAVVLYSLARILALILTTVLHSEWARFLTEERRQALQRWGWRVLVLGASLLWLRSQLYLFTIYDRVIGVLSSALQYPIGSERIHFTLAGVLSFFLILLLGYALTRAITLVLEKVILSRLPLQYGLPYAVSKVTYYLLLVLVVMAALVDAGVELNKFTVIIGAVGVGLGFGLQNIVNNFVSGLILLFERPIRVGDTVDVSGVVGTVTRIGARSSTVQTFQDAEVIVPNSSLISNQVINWTLSSQRRRAEVPVGVAYGTDPERVLNLLVEVAESHTGVLQAPKLMAFFLGFGESALNFELRFYAQQDTWF
jgi:potassium-dependent mechanosensitive channel